MDGGAWQATVHGVAKSQTRVRDFTFNYLNMNFLKIEEVHRLIVSYVAWENISDISMKVK